MLRTSFISLLTLFPLSLSIYVIIFLSFFQHFNLCKGLLATGCVQVLSVYFSLLYPFFASTICDLLLVGFNIWYELQYQYQKQYQKQGMGRINRWSRISRYFCRIISKQSKNSFILLLLVSLS